MSQRAFGAPHRYLQGPGALDELGGLVRLYGRRPFVVADALVAGLLRDRVLSALGDASGGVTFGDFGGECTAAEIDRMAAAARAAGSDVVVGLGGGKAIDTAKGIRIANGGALVVVPTIASNDSPTSRLAVLYTGAHVLSEVRLMTTNPDVVLVDTSIIVQAPPRFFVAGMGDALSKKFEVEQCHRSGGKNFYRASATQLALAAAESCYQVIRRHGIAALQAVSRRVADEAVEDVVEATILSSGLAFESGGLSVAHSLTRGLSAVSEIARALHGEQVAFGLLVQLVAEGRPPEFLRELVEFYRQIRLPLSLRDLGLQGDPASAIRLIARRTLAEAPYIRQFQVALDEDGLAEAIARAHGLSAG